MDYKRIVTKVTRMFLLGEALSPLKFNPKNSSNMVFYEFGNSTQSIVLKKVDSALIFEYSNKLTEEIFGVGSIIPSLENDVTALHHITTIMHVNDVVGIFVNGTKLKTPETKLNISVLPFHSSFVVGNRIEESLRTSGFVGTIQEILFTPVALRKKEIITSYQRG